jgi:hypothetical protein
MKNLSRTELILLFGILLFNIFLLFYIIELGGISGFSVFGDNEPKSPYDFIHEEDISAEGNKVVIEIENPIFSKYTGSGSMEPVLSLTATGIGFKPNSEEDIHLGDIISFRQDGNLIVHRVIEKGEDEMGIYFITQGDNNSADDGKVRFEQVESVLVAIVY